MTSFACILVAEKWHFGLLKYAVLLFFNMHYCLILLYNSFLIFSLCVTCSTCFSFYVQACPKLIDRFKEREENVKASPNDIYLDLFITVYEVAYKILFCCRWMYSIHSLNCYVKLGMSRKGKLTLMNWGKFLSYYSINSYWTCSAYNVLKLCINLHDFWIFLVKHSFFSVV